MIKRAGVFSTGVDDLSNSVAFEYFREGCFVDVAHSHHIEKVTGVVEHHLLLTGSQGIFVVGFFILREMDRISESRYIRHIQTTI